MKIPWCDSYYDSLSEEACRFVLLQQMSFLIWDLKTTITIKKIILFHYVYCQILGP